MFKEIAPNIFEIPQEKGMNVPGIIVASKELLDQPDMDEPIKQVRNVACLPGIVGYSIAMPDIHWGYGFPIGGVAAMDAEQGVISPGGVGYDINCGVRLATAPIPFSSIDDTKQKKLLETLFKKIPSGVGHGHKGTMLNFQDYKEIAKKGSKWSIDNGKGIPQDLESTESHGCIEGADIDTVSATAQTRGSRQIGTIGSGNHFVEIGYIEEIDHPATAAAWNLQVGQVYILIHSGSRGFGHQICTDTIETFLREGFDKNLPDKQLVAAPIQSSYGKHYFGAMACAANFAFNNRQHILHYVREAFHEHFGLAPDQIPLLYDVCHNIAKFETYNGRKLCVHRKGATRAFGPGHPELASRFQTTGQPVIIPGDMGRASYIMAGLGNQMTWCSCCHGAGRQRSRVKSMKEWQDKDPIEFMKQQGVKVMATSYRTIAEEMPDAYKDVTMVVEAAHTAGLALKVAKLTPKLVIKG